MARTRSAMKTKAPLRTHTRCRSPCWWSRAISAPSSATRRWIASASSCTAPSPGRKMFVSDMGLPFATRGLPLAGCGRALRRGSGRIISEARQLLGCQLPERAHGQVAELQVADAGAHQALHGAVDGLEQASHLAFAPLGDDHHRAARRRAGGEHARRAVVELHAVEQ